MEEPAELTAEAGNSGVATEKAATKTTTVKRPGSTKAAASGSAGKRFGDGAASGSTRKGAPVPRSGGRGRGGRQAPPVRVGQPKPWGIIAATVAVLLFAVAAIGYAVYQANSTAIPNAPEDIEGISIATYASQKHVSEDQTYEESPPVGGLHDIEPADCDGTVYDQQIREENAVHSLEHGAVWITYNPDEISDDDLAVLSDYVTGQGYMMLSPYAGLSSLISLQSWNHQVFVDAVDDPRINEFVQLLRQNPATHPEAGATCTSPTFLSDPILEGEPSRSAGDVVTGAPPTP
ncbi:MAG: DUF3105 domain-containing protein [Geodermatophilaceae bacterium]